ncbi:MAG: ribonuclease P protein component 4 [Candidatus Heimdallarchaeaceae archaeon]
MEKNIKNKNKSKKRRFSRSKNPTIPQKLILEQVVYLLEKADEVIKKDIELAQNYAQQARRIQIKTRINFPTKWKKRFCKHCKTFLHPGINCRIRLSSSNKVIVIKCGHCNKFTRIPYYKAKKVVG